LLHILAAGHILCAYGGGLRQIWLGILKTDTPEKTQTPFLASLPFCANPLC